MGLSRQTPALLLIIICFHCAPAPITRSEDPNLRRQSALPGFVFCKKTFGCQNVRKVDAEMFGSCGALIERAQAYPRATQAMIDCTERQSCETYDFHDCLDAFGNQLLSEGMSAEAIEALVWGEQQ